MQQSKKRRSYQFGLIAEMLSIVWLLCRGYRLLAWRFRHAVGEIDVVVMRGTQLVLVEVKARKKRPSTEVITQKQWQRMARAADQFLARHPHMQHCTLRYDVICWGLDHLPSHEQDCWRP